MRRRKRWSTRGKKKRGGRDRNGKKEDDHGHARLADAVKAKEDHQRQYALGQDIVIEKALDRQVVIERILLQIGVVVIVVVIVVPMVQIMMGVVLYILKEKQHF